MSWKVQTGRGGKFILVQPDAVRSNVLLETDNVENRAYYAEYGYHPVTSYGARRFDTKEEAHAVAAILNERAENEPKRVLVSSKGRTRVVTK